MRQPVCVACGSCVGNGAAVDVAVVLGGAVGTAVDAKAVGPLVGAVLGDAERLVLGDACATTEGDDAFGIVGEEAQAPSAISMLAISEQRRILWRIAFPFGGNAPSIALPGVSTQ